jgi:hypothetical protein
MSLLFIVKANPECLESKVIFQRHIEHSSFHEAYMIHTTFGKLVLPPFRILVVILLTYRLLNGPIYYNGPKYPMQSKNSNFTNSVYT